jgi:hypothetical protein
VFAFADAELVLEPGQSVTVPMWLHLLEAGRFDFQCIWFCEPQVSFWFLLAAVTLYKLAAVSL